MPELREELFFQVQAVISLFTDVRRCPGIGAVNQFENVARLTSLPCKAVAAGHAVRKKGRIGTLQRLLRDFRSYLGVCIGGQPAVTAAGRTVAGVLGFNQGDAELPGQITDGFLRRGVPAGTAGVMQGGGAVQTVRTLRRIRRAPFCRSGIRR